MQHEMTRTKLQSEVIRRAWESVQFKQKLLSQPKEALKEIGFPLHDEIEVVVVQEHKKKIVLVLPESPLQDLQEYVNGPIPPLSQAGCPPPTHACLTENCQETARCPQTGLACGITNVGCPPPTAESCPHSRDMC